MNCGAFALGAAHEPRGHHAGAPDAAALPAGVERLVLVVRSGAGAEVGRVIVHRASPGLNVAAGLRPPREPGPEHVVATVALDTGLKYRSSDLSTSDAAWTEEAA